MRALDIAATGLQTQQTYVDVISQNLANTNTTGYKAQRPEFTDLLYQNRRSAGTSSSDNGTLLPTGIQLGLGSRLSSISRDVSQSSITQSSGSLDMALSGRGYFQITLPDGTTGYTRDGSFQKSADGNIVTKEGFQLTPTITIPSNATSISIDASGQVSVTLPTQAAASILGTIQTAVFVNEEGLQAQGNNLFTETAASGSPITGTPNQDGFGGIRQGYLEDSNVDSTKELTNLIKAQRVYEMNSKVITKVDAMLQSLNQSV
jgi:flagellar basal-body rod protein FlgG